MLAHTPCSLTNALVSAETTPKHLTLSKMSNVFVGLGHPSVRNRSAITSIALHADPVSASGAYLQSGRTFQDNARGPRARLLKCDRREKDHVVGHKLGHIFFFIAAMASTMEKFPLAG
jgi:hypothetical protein